MHTIDNQVKELETPLYSSKAKTQKIEGVSKIQINEIIEEKTTLENTINSLIKLLETDKNNDVKIILLKTISNNKLILFSC